MLLINFQFVFAGYTCVCVWFEGMMDKGHSMRGTECVCVCVYLLKKDSGLCRRRSEKREQGWFGHNLATNLIAVHF